MNADAYKKGNLKFTSSKYEEAVELYTKGLGLIVKIIFYTVIGQLHI